MPQPLSLYGQAPPTPLPQPDELAERLLQHAKLVGQLKKDNPLHPGIVVPPPQHRETK